ncbi:MAG: hypothetical protein V3V21_08215 [Thermoplasmata archaeon]
MLVDGSGVPGVSPQGVSVESLANASRGRLVFQDDVDVSSQVSYIMSLRQILVFRVSLVSCAMILYSLLVKSLLEETIVPMRAFILLTIVVTVLMLDFQFFARFEHSVLPLRIYENGIEMPTTWFERILLRRRFVSWDDVETILTVRHNIIEEREIVRGIETEIVLVTRDGLTYSTFVKDRTEIKKAIDVISSLWGRLYEEKARIEDLERRGTGFSRIFVSIHPRSILLQSSVFNILLFVPLGISILLDADMTITVIIAAFVAILTLVFGYIMIRIGRARTELFAPPSIILDESSQ